MVYQLVAWTDKGQVKMLPELLREYAQPYMDRIESLRAFYDEGWDDGLGRLTEQDVLALSRSYEAYGRFLRASSLDELPELFNILLGQMALVGPRPLLVQYLPYYTEEEKHRHDVRPGLTGLAQVNGRNLIGWDERLRYDTEYVKHITFTGDLRILLKTVRKVFTHEDLAVDTDTAETYLDEERKERRGAPDDQSIYA